MSDLDQVVNGAGEYRPGKALTADEILAKRDLKVRAVYVPEWDGYVWIRSLGGDERDGFEESLVKGRGNKRSVQLRGARARLVQTATIQGPDPADVEAGLAEEPDPKEARSLFSPAQVKALGKKNGAALDLLFDAIRELSGMKEGAVEEFVDELGEG